jgi:membrane associated rhomboid family serine protease
MDPVRSQAVGAAEPAPQPEPAPVTITADMLAEPAAGEGRVDFERGMSVFPRVCLALIVANVGVFAWEAASGALASPQSIIAAGALHRASVLAGEVWRIPWSTFLHGGVGHLVGNCIAL